MTIQLNLLTLGYTEYQMAKMAAAKYKPSKASRRLTDYITFESMAEETMSGIIEELSNLQVDHSQRVAFYPLGARVVAR